MEPQVKPAEHPLFPGDGNKALLEAFGYHNIQKISHRRALKREGK